MRRSGSGPLTIHKAIELLRTFTPDSPEFGVRELASRVGMPRSTVHRILNALQEEGLLEVNPNTGRYRLGLELVAIAGTALRSIDVRRVALPHMSQLAALWNETVDLDVLRGANILIVEQIPGQHILSTGGALAALLPAHCTSTGKVLLAFAGKEYVMEHLPAELPRYTPRTITSRETLLRELARVRQQGYARAWGEYEEYVHALGVPIRDRSGQVIAAMSISGLAARIDETKAQEMIRALKQAATQISAALGYVDR